MEIHLTAEQQTQFAKLAAYEGRKLEDLTHEALSRYLSEEAKFIAAVLHGEAALDRGEILTHQEVGAQLDRLLKA